MRSFNPAPLDAREFAFAPDAARGHRLDQAVREGLAESLSILFDALAPGFAVDRRAARAIMRRIRAGRIGSGLFGAYVDLVVAAFDERMDHIQGLLDEILANPQAVTAGLRIVTLDDAELGPGQADRCRRLLRDDIDVELAPVPVAARGRAEARLSAALGLLEAGAPEVFGELSALLGQVVLVTEANRGDAIGFGGASTFSLWGSIAMNTEVVDDRLDGAVMLAHEAAHCHLFGLAHGGRLVENDDEQRHPSPLRLDRRPMEGVAHATFVTARMIHALSALQISGALNPAEAARAPALIDRYRAAYAEGLEIVLAGARFTPAGAAVYEGLARYMDEPGRADGR